MACIIEFCGKPGSGKSTVCRELLRRIRKDHPEKRVVGLFADDKNPAAGMLVKVFVFMVYPFFNLGRFVSVSKRFFFPVAFSSHSEASVRLLNAIFLDYRLRRSLDGNDIILLDQGFMQLYWSAMKRPGLEVGGETLLALYGPFSTHVVKLVTVVIDDGFLSELLVARPDISRNRKKWLNRFDMRELDQLYRYVALHQLFFSIVVRNEKKGYVDMDTLIKEMR